ncbi:hypothetical protein [Streptomyces sp. MB09-02B]|uniref:hypothetical protein n=1 Tax=Streptomyces sp. MB09-02B TaxID=3028667 RepID=UPI0029B6DD2B|nr:hypothetical protein [Streptomyces sp. MB09-02B]MDX3642479.1 hypothetical protein [Streptomyces sp. MB09-02B]
MGLVLADDRTGEVGRRTDARVGQRLDHLGAHVGERTRLLNRGSAQLVLYVRPDRRFQRGRDPTRFLSRQFGEFLLRMVRAAVQFHGDAGQAVPELGLQCLESPVRGAGILGHRVVQFADLLLQAVMGGSWVLQLSCPDAQFTDAPPRGPVFGAQAPPEAYRCCGHGKGEPLGDGQEAVGRAGGDGQGGWCRSGEQRGGRHNQIPPSPTGKPAVGPGGCHRNPRSRRDAARHPGGNPMG